VENKWTAPCTGTVIAALSGRQIVQILCKKEGKRFGEKGERGKEKGN